MAPWIERIVLPAGWHMAPHAHPEFCELMLVESGRLRVHAEGRTAEAGPGEMAIYAAGAHHEEWAVGRGPLRACYLGWRTTATGLPLVRADQDGRIAQILDWLLAADLAHRDAGLWPHLLGALEHALLQPPSDPGIERLRQAVRGDLSRPWTVGDLARLAGRPRSTFHRWFRAALHDTPAGWIRRERVAEAGRLLRHGLLPLVAIAAQVGLRDGSELSRLVRRLTGRRPSDLRRG